MAFIPPANAIVEEEDKPFVPPVNAVVEREPAAFTPPASAVVEETTFTPPVEAEVQAPPQPAMEETPAPEAPKIRYKDLSAKDEYFKVIEDYANSSRFGGKVQREKGESREDFVDRFATHMRMLDSGNMISNTQEQEWLNGAPPEEVIKAGKAYSLFKNTASFTEEGGDSTLNALLDYGKATISDPTTLFGFGAGKLAVSGLTKLGRATGMFMAPVIEGYGAGYSEVSEQKRDIAVADVTAANARAMLNDMAPEDRPIYERKIQELENKVAQGIDKGEVAKSAAFGATFGLIEPAALLLGSKAARKATAENLDSILKTRKEMAKQNAQPQKLTGDPKKDTAVEVTTSLKTGEQLDLFPTDAVKQMDDLNIPAGRQTLDAQGEPTNIAQMEIKSKISKQAVEIATNVWKQMPELGIQKGETVDNAINRTLKDLGALPDDVFESLLIKDGGDMQKFVQTLADADIDIRQFADANSVSVSEGARRMQALSVVARLENKLKNLDKRVLDQVKAFYNPGEAANPHTNALNAIKDFVIKADKNMIVAMTMNASTLSRNVFGMGANATVGVGEEAVESIVFSIGKTLAEKVSGRPVTGSIGKASKQATKDALGLMFYINEPALTTDITQSVLKDSPALMNKLLLTAEEMKKSDLYRPVQILNTPAVMVDKFVRQAVFSSSLERNMRRNGLNMYDVMAQGKNIPVEILRKSVDDAVAFTFSKHPTNPILSGFVKLVENTRPISSLAFPFARFMANAAEWTLERYNPLYAITGTSDLAHGINLARKGEFDAGLSFINRGSEKIGKQTIGMISFLGAYGYRQANQDTPWDQITADDNTKVSAKYLFPLNIPLALADYVIKWQNKRTNEFNVRELVEAVVGYKSTVGTQDWFIDRVTEWAGNLTGDEPDEVLRDKLGQLTGEFFGKFLGRATVPLNQVSDILSAFDRDEALPRDAYVMQPGEERGFTTSFTKMMQKGVPILKQALPEYQPATRDVAPYRDSGPLKQFTGLAIEPYKNKLEAEISRLNIKYQDIYRGTGNRTFDAEARATMARLLPYYITPMLESNSYKNATREGQRNELVVQLKTVQSEAKKMAKEISIANAYKKREAPQILIDQYLNIKQDILPIVKAQYKKMNGISFDEDDSFLKYEKALAIHTIVKQYPAVMSNPKGFALGGMVGKQAAKQVGKKSIKGLASASMDLLDEMQTKIAKKSAPVTEDITQQTQKAMPSAAEPQGLAKYTPEEVSAAEQQAMQMEGSSTMEWLKKNQPEKYENTVFIHMNKTDPEPYPGAGTVYDYLDDEGVYDFTKTVAQKEVEQPKGLMQPVDEPVIIASDKAVKGLIKNVRNTADRNDMLEQIREIRTQRFPKLKVEGVEDSVIGVAQGDFRIMNGREADPSKAKDRSLFTDLAKKKQKELDRLRIKYKDTPPVEIFHGNPDRAAQLSKEGFAKPQRQKFMHSELEVAAPSFTKDLNLQFNTGSFGGTDPSAFVSTKIPYADYLFSRVNMPKTAYENKDLDVIARAISGDPASTRPLSLPREGSMNETEDAFVEADKLLINRADTSVASKLPDYKSIAAKRDLHQQSYSDLVKDWDKMDEKQQVMAANKAYKDVREMFKTYASAAKITSTKTGMGQQYTAAVARSPVYAPMLNKIADILEKQGSTERASLLRKIGSSIAELRKAEDRVPATRAIQEAASKLAKGGLASRK